MKKVKYLIVGASAGGVSAANSLARLDPGAEILCVTAENSLPYNKCFLVDWLCGKKSLDEVELKLNPSVELMLGKMVSQIDILNQTACLSDGTRIEYDSCLLAIGVRAIQPPIAGLGTASVYNFHTFNDAYKLKSAIEQRQLHKAVVVGAGLTGLEIADALWQLGIHVSVIERSSQVLGGLIDEAGATYLADVLQRSKVDLYCNTTIKSINTNTIKLSSDLNLAADALVLATGVRPNQILIANGVLQTENGYITVDKYFRTNLSNLWAVGDAIVLPSWFGGQLVPSCSWPDAVQQGSLAAHDMVRKGKPYSGIFTVAKSNFFGLDFASFGSLSGEIKVGTPTSAGYRKCFLDSSGVVTGAVLLGDQASFLELKQSAITRMPVKYGSLAS